MTMKKEITKISQVSIKFQNQNWGHSDLPIYFLFQNKEARYPISKDKQPFLLGARK